MGFYYQKTLKFGPINLNFSKSGFGTSVGFKGARIGINSIGTYVHLGGSGIYFKKYLKKRKNQSAYSLESDMTETKDSLLPATEYPEDPIVKALNKRREKLSFAQIFIILYTIFASYRFTCATWKNYQIYNTTKIEKSEKRVKNKQNTESEPTSNILKNLTIELIIGSSIFLTLLPLAIYIDYRRKRSIINLEIPDHLEEYYLQPLDTILTEIAESKLIKILKSQKAFSINERKYNSGSTSDLELEKIKLYRRYPNFTKLNHKPFCLEYSDLRIFFLPHVILIDNPVDGLFYSFPVEETKFILTNERIVWTENVPKDSNIADYTYQYVNKKGGPDKRFSNNHQIPIIDMTSLTIVLQEENTVSLYISNSQVSKKYHNVIDEINRYFKAINLSTENSEDNNGTT